MSQLAGLILCGGESRRMGQPKAWLPFGSETLLQRVTRVLSTVASPLVVVAAPGQNLPKLSSSVLVVRDPVSYRGPLQGLASGLAALPNSVDLVYASSTDAPFLRTQWIERLVQLIGEHDLALPHAGGQDHPLAALYRRAATLPAILDLIAANRMRLAFLKDMVKTRVVLEDDLSAIDPKFETLQNLNTPDEYQRALRDAGN